MNWLRRAAARIYDGGIQIGWRVGRWPWQDPHKGERAVRAVLLAAVLAVLWWIGQAVPRVAGLLLVAFAVAAFRAGEAEQDAADAEEEDLLPPVVRCPEETLLRMVVTLIGQGPGIHLDTLLTALRTQPRWAAMEREDLRALLAGLGCPVRRTLRVGERTGAAGVHRDDAANALARWRTDNPSPTAADAPADDM